MSLAYPVAKSVHAALSGTAATARTRFEAEQICETQKISGLVTDWFTPKPGELQAVLDQALSGEVKGFVQVYEDKAGQSALAVTYWKMEEPPKVEPRREAPAKQAQEDDTDDLYFKHGRTKRSQRRKTDPAQLDLFSGSQSDK